MKAGPPIARGCGHRISLHFLCSECQSVARPRIKIFGTEMAPDIEFIDIGGGMLRVMREVDATAARLQAG